MSEIDDKTVSALISAAGNARIYKKDDLESRDPGWHPENLGAGLAIAPSTTKEVSDILSFCNRAGVGVVPHGGLTGLAGGVASGNGQIIMMLTGLRSTTVDPESGVAVVDRRHPHGLWFDLSVPQKHLDDYVAGMMARVTAVDPKFRVFIMGHLGDGNLHLTISRGRPAKAEYLRVADAVYEGLAALGGSFSAEHGIGIEKKASMSRLVDPVKLELMRSIKHLLDPNGIMNPGKVF